MAYNTWSHWLSGLYPSSGILNTREYNVSGKAKTQIQVDTPTETSCTLEFRFPDDG
jgi:hypothetical protein